ncbi:hypothetical protein F4808DRAFT_428339 [Astrocystis sublimbata]|nr:hypothetical protein F4808DRAFT_428339 [Astrocystis sublimbata]
MSTSSSLWIFTTAQHHTLLQQSSHLGVTPQRQVDFPSPPNTQAVLEAMMAEFATTDQGHTIEVRKSFLEPGLQALRRRLTVPTDQNGGPIDAVAAINTRDSYGGEIYHPHRDGTSHVILHPEDSKRVIEAGWGERHPFCTVPVELNIIYAPRHEGELQVVRQILQAAVWYGTGGDLHAIDATTYKFPPAPAPSSA